MKKFAISVLVALAGIAACPAYASPPGADLAVAATFSPSQDTAIVLASVERTAGAALGVVSSTTPADEGGAGTKRQVYGPLAGGGRYLPPGFFPPGSTIKPV